MGQLLPVAGAAAGYALAPETAGASLLMTGAGMEAGSMVAGGIAQSQSSQYQAQVARNNQIVANQYATQAVQDGQVQEQNMREKTAQQESMIRAVAGASGLDSSSGSALRAQEGTAMVGEQDALTIRNNAQKAAYGYTVQGLSYAGQAQLDTLTANNALAAGTMKGIGSLVSSAGTVSSKWGYLNSGNGPG